MKYPNILYTVRNNICTGCGICSAACPSSAITTITKNGLFIPQIDNSKCNNERGCHRCYDSCPGVGVELEEKSSILFNHHDSSKNKYIGHYINCYTGYSADNQLRYHAASGGLVSRFLIWLFEKKIIDGAVVTSFDKSAPLKVRSFIASSIEDIRNSKSSKYSPVSLHQAIQELKKKHFGKYVVVGLPCHIEGMRKLMEIDKSVRERVIGLFSLYCSGTRSFYMTEYLMKKRGIDMDSIDYLAYRDNGCLGGMVVKGEDIDYYEDYQSYYHPLRSFFTPRRCHLCVDHFGELADVSFGDIHVAPYSKDKVGVNSVVVRSSYWNELIKQAHEEGFISLESLDVDVLLQSQKMSKVKKSRYMGFCIVNERFKKVSPKYGTTYGINPSIATYIHYFRMAFERYVGSHKKLWFLIPILKAKVNIH